MQENKHLNTNEEALTTLMGGAMSDKDKIYQSFHWLKKDYPGISQDDIRKMQAVLYALAAKFLNQEDLNKLKGRLQ